MQDAPHRACWAPHRACRTRRTGMQDRACRTRRTGMQDAAPRGMQHAPHRAFSTRHSRACNTGSARGSAPHMRCPSPSIRMHTRRVCTSQALRHTQAHATRTVAPRLNTVAPRLNTVLSPPASHDARVRCAQHPFHTSHARATGTALRTAHVAAPRLFAIARLSIRFTQCTVSLAASPLHPTP